MSSYLFPKILPAPHTDQTWFCSPSTSLSVPTKNQTNAHGHGQNSNNSNYHRQNRSTQKVQLMYTNLDALEQEEEQYSRKLHQIAHTPAPEPIGIGMKASNETTKGTSISASGRNLHRSFLETNTDHDDLDDDDLNDDDLNDDGINQSRRRRRDLRNDGTVVETDSEHSSHDHHERYRMTTPTQQTDVAGTRSDRYPSMEGRRQRRRRRGHEMDDDDLDHPDIDTDDDDEEDDEDDDMNGDDINGDDYESDEDYQDNDSSTVVANRMESYRSMSLTPSSHDQSQSLTSSLSLSSSMNHSMDR